MPTIVKHFGKQHELDGISEEFAYRERREKVGDENVSSINH